MDILERIDEIRIAKGWSIYKLAEECEITPSTLSNMYSRKTLPSLSTLISICKGCGITLSQFFAEEKSDIENEEEKILLNEFRKLSQKNKDAITQLIKNVS